ncbi:hypothetical protein A5733_08785 [Mycobacterium sp. NS-7484]|uniref:hypothetical protein n=1 Tax=Mycobacterium sp. NS-7484 TaxID=1834161 RepID=UPI00096CA655|nr:hypothetical protein [Mycobacterium sp. NS-7484]OMB98175.1 hypothetical protein A5733_08785 [Mycobacterium sp. NS-7484]
MSDDGQLPADQPDEDDDRTRIIRRQPQAPLSRPEPVGADPKTSIIRRHPTGAIPSAAGEEPQTGLIGDLPDEAVTSYVPHARPTIIPRMSASTDPRTAIAAATLAILGGWATGVIATDLIAGWWRTDRLFCVAIGFLAAISAAATIVGLIALLLRRRMGRLLVVVGAVIGLLIFGSLFIAGAQLHPVVYAMPALPLAAILFTVLPSTGRWAARDK